MIQPSISQMLQAWLHVGEDAEPVIYHIFSHETAAWKATNWVFSFKVCCLWQVFCSASLCLSFLPLCCCLPSLLPCQHSCSAESWFGEWIQLKANIAKMYFLEAISCFPDCFYPSLLTHSIVVLDHDTGGGNGQGLGGSCLSWCCRKRKCIKKPQPEVQGL